MYREQGKYTTGETLKAYYGEILAAPLDQGAKVVVRKDPARVREVHLDDPGILADIDTPEDYARWTGRTVSFPSPSGRGQG